jgi:hypothetical protein
MSFNKIPLGRDMFERVLSTFVVAAGGVALSDGVGLADIVHLNLWKVAGIAGLTAVLTLVKTVFAAATGGGASFDPAVKLQPEPVSKSI